MRAFIAGTIGLLMCATAAQAEDLYPTQPITIVAPFGPGSATDIFTRAIAEGLEREIGQSVVVENRPGGNAAIAAQHVATAPPDGYTLMMSTASAHASNVHLLETIPYDPIEDFEPVSWVGTVGFFFAVNGDSAIETMADFVEEARGRPGELTIGTANASGIVASQAMANSFDIDVIHIPYQSTPAAMTDLLGGRLDMMIADTASAAEHISAGTMRGVTMAAGKRSELYPDMPTLDEEGVEGFDLVGWLAIFAPADTPAQIIEKLNQSLQRVADDQSIQDRLNRLGYEVFATSSEELRAHNIEQIDTWAHYVSEYDLELQ